jgi:transcriptional regulator GlxA family with amidase domain
MAGASSRTLARLFRCETGMSFQAWRRQLRLTEGLAALSESETPARVTATVGYSGGPAFRAAFGTAPGRSRQG